MADAGIRPDKRDRYPWSPLMRAVTAKEQIKGTKVSRRKQSRISTCAAAVHTAISTGMTNEDLASELTHLPIRGEKHGIEHLAAQARKTQRALSEEQASAEITQALAGLNQGGAYCVSGNFDGVEPGIRLIAIEVPADTTGLSECRGQIVEPGDDALAQHLLANWIKSRNR